jgi:1-acyl-sn-glycerol-3-phosphate acyltransferase
MVWRLLAFVRSILGILFLIPWTILYSVITIVLGNLNCFARADRYVRFWARSLLDAFGVEVKLHGVENIPTDRGVLFVFNHQSHFDILALKAHVPRVLSFGAKAELFKIPFFGPAMRALGTLPIDRDNRSEVFRVYKEAQERFSSTLNFILAPEGTRQSKPEIGIFKKGPFIFAINGQVPVVPVVIAGAYEILPKHSLVPNSTRLSRTVHMEFLPPIETAGLTSHDAAKIRDEAYSQVLRTFTKLHPLIEPL